jgi:hypothetical protein
MSIINKVIIGIAAFMAAIVCAFNFGKEKKQAEVDNEIMESVEKAKQIDDKVDAAPTVLLRKRLRSRYVKK